MQPKKTRTVSKRLYFTCWHFCDPEKNLGAALAAGLFVQQPTAFFLVATWYVVAFWSHTKMVRNFAKRSALDCAAREQPEEMARVQNDGQMTIRRAQKVCTIPPFLAAKRREVHLDANLRHWALSAYKYLTQICVFGP